MSCMCTSILGFAHDRGPAGHSARREWTQAPESARDRHGSRRATLRRSWAQFRRNRLGMIGLGVLIFFVLMAVFAPLIAPREQTSEVYAAKNQQPIAAAPGYQCPTGEYVTDPTTGKRTPVNACAPEERQLLPTRHRRCRTIGAGTAGLGRPDLTDRRRRRDLDDDGDRCRHRHGRWLLRRRDGRGARAPHRLVPRDSRIALAIVLAASSVSLSATSSWSLR